MRNVLPSLDHYDRFTALPAHLLDQAVGEDLSLVAVDHDFDDESFDLVCILPTRESFRSY